MPKIKRYFSPEYLFFPVFFVASPFTGKPLSHTQTAIERGGERCPNVREAS